MEWGLGRSGGRKWEGKQGERESGKEERREGRKENGEKGNMGIRKGERGVSGWVGECE